MSTAFYVGRDNVSTTTTGYTAGAGALALAAGAGALFGSTFPLLVSTFLADGTPKGVYSVTGRSADTLTGLTLVSGTDADLPPGSVVQVRWTAEHAAQVAAAVNALEVTAAGLGSASTHPASDFDTAGAAGAVSASLSTHVADTGNPHAVTKSQVGLGSVDNTSDAGKPVSTATVTALALKAPLASPALTGTPTVPTAAPGTNTTQAASAAFVVAAVAAAPAPSFNPAALFDLLCLDTSVAGVLWQDSARTTPATADGDPVGGWSDLSAAANHATQTTAGNRYTLKTGQPHGHPVVRSDGTQTFLRFTAISGIGYVCVVVRAAGLAGLAPNVPVLGSEVTFFDFVGGTDFGAGAAWPTQLIDSSSSLAVIRNGVAAHNGVPVRPLDLVKPPGLATLELMLASATAHAQNLGNDRNAGRIWNGDYAFVGLATAVPGLEDRRRLLDYLWTTFGTIGLAPPLIFFCGDSMTADTTAPIRTVNDLIQLGGYSVSGRIAGYAGWTSVQVASKFTADVFPSYHPGRAANVDLFWAGSNDLYFGASAATAYANIKTACLQLRSAGFRVVVCTVLPRSDVGTPGTFNADRATVNASIVADAVKEGWAAAVADIASDATMGGNGQETNTTYYADLVHPTTAGYNLLADTYFAPALAKLL